MRPSVGHNLRIRVAKLCNKTENLRGSAGFF
jgi:hypothetical protein